MVFACFTCIDIEILRFFRESSIGKEKSSRNENDDDRNNYQNYNEDPYHR